MLASSVQTRDAKRVQVLLSAFEEDLDALYS
jgi:hypothetical protein